MMFDVMMERNPTWPLGDMMDKFYHSRTCALLSDQETGFFTYSHVIIADLFEAELQGEQAFDEMLYQVNY